MLNFTITKNNGQPADSATIFGDGTASPTEQLILLEVVVLQNDVEFTRYQFLEIAQDDTVNDVMARFDAQIEFVPEFDSVIVGGTLMALEPVAPYEIRISGTVDGDEIPGSAEEPDDPDDPDDPVVGRADVVGFLNLPAERLTETPNANWVNGMNNTGMGIIGISTENPNLEQSLPSWTYLDQSGNARNPQQAGHIGASTLGDVELGVNDANGTGQFYPTGPAKLELLEIGWEADVVIP